MEELRKELVRQRELNSRQSEVLQRITGQNDQLTYQQQYHEFRKRAELQKKIDSEIASKFEKQREQEKQRFDHFHDPHNLYPWINYSSPALTEKIDYSSINLRSTGKPPSLVDLAKMVRANSPI